MSIKQIENILKRKFEEKFDRKIKYIYFDYIYKNKIYVVLENGYQIDIIIKENYIDVDFDYSNIVGISGKLIKDWVDENIEYFKSLQC